jgi:hypothetical protein
MRRGGICAYVSAMRQKLCDVWQARQTAEHDLLLGIDHT